MSESRRSDVDEVVGLESRGRSSVLLRPVRRVLFIHPTPSASDVKCQPAEVKISGNYGTAARDMSALPDYGPAGLLLYQMGINNRI